MRVPDSSPGELDGDGRLDPGYEYVVDVQTPGRVC